jgi:MFS transporter, DHA2 family, methylenomycin A resistance protein
MLPLSLFSRRLSAVSSLIGLLVNIAFYGLIFVLSLYFQTLNGLSPFATGLAFLPMTGAVLPTNLWSANATQRFGAKTTIAAGAAVAAVGCLALLKLARGTSYWLMCIQLMAIGAGLGLLVPALTSALLGTVEKARSGVASGVLNATRQTGSVLGVALFGSFVGKTDTFLQGARLSLVISAIALLGAPVAIIFDGE